MNVFIGSLTSKTECMNWNYAEVGYSKATTLTTCTLLILGLGWRQEKQSNNKKKNTKKWRETKNKGLERCDLSPP